MNVYKKIQENIALGKKQLAVLLDPDKLELNELFLKQIHLFESNNIDFFFVGGSIVEESHFENTIEFLSKHSKTPIILFPGAHYQIHKEADAVLFLSLISGRNPEYLIGQQVKASKSIEQIQLETIATGYILVDGGRMSTTAYVTQTQAIPRNEIDICVSTALAAKLMGMQAIYLEAGSGAHFSVPTNMIRAVKKEVKLPLIVGGGIRSKEDAQTIFDAGADIIVIGNALEKNPELIGEICDVCKN
jgi:putative glycerol-1-phosphate prenyltransferase